MIAIVIATMAVSPSVYAHKMTVSSPPEIDFELLHKVLKDGKLDPGDLVGPVFQQFWYKVSQEIGRVNLCRSVTADIGAGSKKPPYTDWVKVTVVSPDGRSKVTYQQPIRVYDVRPGVTGISPIKADGSYGRGITCGQGLKYNR